MDEDNYAQALNQMVNTQLIPRGIRNPRVLAAFRRVPRHRFVPSHLWDQAYNDYPLPIGEDQTISQPYIVALMTEILEPREGDRVLEMGAGSGYQAAVLAELVAQVFTIDRVGPLASRARETAGVPGIRQRQDRDGGRHPGLARGGPLRRHHRHRGGAPGAPAADGAAGPGRPPGDPGGGPCTPRP